MTKFADRLKELRISRNVSQLALSKAIGVSQPAIAQWENRERVPSLDFAFLVAKFFDISLDYLVGLIDEAY